jgi:uncharacterized protein YeaO (DUF488 family)
MARAGDERGKSRASGQIRTRRWNDDVRPDDGTRILVCRYRPRGVRKEEETWDEWSRDLGPTPELHAAVYGKGQRAIGFAEYRRRYLSELAEDPGRFQLRALAERVAAGESITLLCSSACVDESQCHRTILRDLLSGRGRRRSSGG